VFEQGFDAVEDVVEGELHLFKGQGQGGGGGGGGVRLVGELVEQLG
jgi:hypothetical protein